jgi:phenylalanyl-tRNA synthetase beta chain
MRTTLAPAMLKSIATNLNRKAGTVRLFEVNHTYKPKANAEIRKPDGSYALSEPSNETETLCIGIADESQDFFGMKGILEMLFERLGIANVEYALGAACYYHPGRSAVILVNGETIGIMGEVHPDAAVAFEVERKVLLAELNVSWLLSNVRMDYAIRPLPKYPSVSRDLAVSVDKLCPVGGMLNVIRKAGGKLLESAELFDIYEGKQAGEGKKSVAFSLVFRAADHTLVDEEASGCFEAVVQALSKEFSAEIRK